MSRTIFIVFCTNVYSSVIGMNLSEKKSCVLKMNENIDNTIQYNTTWLTRTSTKEREIK